jgi:hypothetical protein
MLAWMIGGQSNAVGHGPYVGVWPGDARVVYMVNSKITPFAPNPNSITPGGVNTNGSELGIGPAVADTHPGEMVAISKAATDSLTIAQLTTGLPWDNTIDGIRRLKTVASYLNYVWIQGEADAQDHLAATYQASLTSMAAAIRTEFEGTVRFYIIKLNSADPPSWDIAGIQAAQAAFVAADPNAVLVDVDDLGPPALGFHYDSGQEITIGQRCAALGP